jgi:hypothetical protein
MGSPPAFIASTAAPTERLRGILFVLEMGCGSGVTCWRRLREWQATGGLAKAPPDAVVLPGGR